MGRTRKAVKMATTAVQGLQQSFELTAFLAHFIIEHHDQIDVHPDGDGNPVEKHRCCFCASERVDDEATGSTMIHESNCVFPIAWEVRGLADELTSYEQATEAQKNVAAIKRMLAEPEPEANDE